MVCVTAMPSATYWKLVEAFRVTIVGAISTSITALTEIPVGNADIASVRMGLTGGAGLSEGRYRAFF